MPSIDIHDPKIERQIGDYKRRTPHYVVDSETWEGGDTTGVLYWPRPGAKPEAPGVVRGEWCARAFHSPADAISFLDRRFGPVNESEDRSVKGT